MPIARRAERTQTLRPLPNIRRTAAETPESMGYGVEQAKARKYLTIGQTFGHAADSVTNTIGKIVKEEQAKAHDKMMLDAGNRLSAFEREYYYGQNGVLRKLGDQANTSPEEFFAAYRQAEAEIRSGLATDDQRFEFDKMSARQFDTMDVTIRRHVLTQQNNALETSLKASTANSVNKAIGARLDPAKADEYMAEMEANMRRTMPKLGIPQDAIDAAVLEQRSNIHEGIVRGYIGDGQDMQARAYLEVMGHEIQEDRRDDLQGAVRASSTKEEATRQFDRIWREGGTIDEKRAKAKTLEDEDVRATTLSMLEHEYAWQKGVQNEAEQELGKQAAQFVLQHPKHSWQAFPKLHELNGAQIAGIKSLSESLVEKTPVQTSFAAFTELEELARDYPATFIETDLTKYLGRVSVADLKNFEERKTRLKNGDKAGASAIAASEGEQARMVNEALRSIGINFTPAELAKRPELQKQSDAMWRQVREDVAQLEVLSGHKATVPEIQGIVDFWIRQTGERHTGSRLWGGNVPAYAFETLSEKNIPRELLPVIDDWLIRNRMGRIESNRLMLWERYQQLTPAERAKFDAEVKAWR